jgi:hypothetical protein
MDSRSFQASVVLTAVLLASRLTPAAETPARVETMTYTQAKARIPDRSLPDFWVGDVKGLAARFEHLERGTATVLAATPGSRPIYMVTYGDREAVAHQANFNSAIGGRDAAAYMHKAARKKPVILFLGPVHGHEVEGLTGLVNLIRVMETGKDLRGRDQERLRELGERCRLLIVPAGNPDGTARFEPRTLQGMADEDLRFWGQGTWKDDTFCDWPQCKRVHPMVGPDVGFLGCYFNDAGVNPMHDEFFAPMGPEAGAGRGVLRPAPRPAIARRLALRGRARERPTSGFLQPDQCPLPHKRRRQLHIRVPSRHPGQLPGHARADSGHSVDTL